MKPSPGWSHRMVITSVKLYEYWPDGSHDSTHGLPIAEPTASGADSTSFKWFLGCRRFGANRAARNAAIRRVCFIARAPSLEARVHIFEAIRSLIGNPRPAATNRGDVLLILIGKIA